MKKFILPIILAVCFILVNVLSIVARINDMPQWYGVFLTVIQVIYFFTLIVAILYYVFKYYNKKK